MTCLHPDCPMGLGLLSWKEVVDDPRIKVAIKDKSALLFNLLALGSFGTLNTNPTPNEALMLRLLEFCPCLYLQVRSTAKAPAVIHMCEITLMKKIDCSNVWEAYLIQNPRETSRGYRYTPHDVTSNVGDIMEYLCSEVLSNEGIPEMVPGGNGWPMWDNLGHVCLNKGKMRSVKAFGDILIPCAPSNIVISVKTEAAKERLLYSSNMIEGVGFGFFKDAKEFWTISRMQLFKRMGFIAIYLPKKTLMELLRKIVLDGSQKHAYNVNGTLLYRCIENFAIDMKKVLGKTSLRL